MWIGPNCYRRGMFNYSNIRVRCCLVGCFAAVISPGCATSKTSNTARTASEQLLISAAIDRSMSTVQFDDFAGRAVFVDDQYLDSVDKGYVVSSIRHNVLQSGGRLAADVDGADLVLEARSGGIGTDSQESFVGTPAIGVPGLPIEIPEIKLVSRSTQIGTAKIAMVAYDPKSGESAGAGGAASAMTHHRDSYVLGVGPFRSGAVVQQRQRSVGFDGTGGSLTGNDRYAARPVPMVDGVVPSAIGSDVDDPAIYPGFPASPAAQIAAEADGTMQR